MGKSASSRTYTLTQDFTEGAQYSIELRIGRVKLIERYQYPEYP